MKPVPTRTVNSWMEALLVEVDPASPGVECLLKCDGGINLMVVSRLTQAGTAAAVGEGAVGVAGCCRLEVVGLQKLNYCCRVRLENQGGAETRGVEAREP